MLAADSTIAGRYRLAALIGEGGMASVWRAEDETLKRSVAIKLLYFGAHRDAQATVEHFLREARIAASIQHRNVIHTVDFGTTELGVPYMVMELLHGESLAARLERAPRLEMEEVVRLASLTLRGLAAVHDAGIVHRDLKPQNVFLQQDAEAVYPKILDFGISRSLAASAERPSAVATQQGLVVGTPHYMAPEQARGETDIDKRADIYAMAVMIYEAITGQMPFDAETSGALLVKIISSRARPMRELRPDVPQVLSDCIEQAMAPLREHRFIDAKVFRRALEGAADSAFPRRVVIRSSELPVGDRLAQLASATDAAVSGKVAADKPRGWGDFEGLSGNSERPGAARSAAGNSPPPARASQIHAPQGGTPAGANSTESPLLGDSPLDGFGAGDEAATHLDLDYGTVDAPRASRHSMPRSSTRASLTGRVGYDDKSAAAQRRRRGPGARWILPALLLLLLTTVLLAPGLFTAPPPDDPAAIDRQAQSPATRGSDRRLSPGRPGNLAKMPPALRELPE
jgi:serine/threonine protein kinase